MLIEFRVGNFLSFDDEQVFSMEAGKIRNNADRVYSDDGFKLLKFNAIYGANASGKSNLVDAFSFSQAVIVQGIPSEISNLYCRVSEDNLNKPSHFEYTIKIGSEKYVYGFYIHLSTGKVTHEYLKKHRYGSKYSIIFSRDLERGFYEVDSYFKEDSINNRLKIYADDVRTDSSILFLRLMNQNKDTLYSDDSPLVIYKKVFNWFRYKLSVNYADRPLTNFSYFVDSESIGEIGKLLNDFGTGVSQVVIADVTLEKVSSKFPKSFIQQIVDELREQKKRYVEKDVDSIPAVMLRSDTEKTMFILQLNDEGLQCKTLEFKHENTETLFSSYEESDGTIRLLDLIEVLLCKDSEKVYIIDEINRRFHPLLTCEFVADYLELAKTRNVQLIVTTHESRLMNLKLLRKDEIGFVDKDEHGRSRVYSLDSFNERFDKKVSAAYLRGEYKAIPRFNIGNSIDFT